MSQSDEQSQEIEDAIQYLQKALEEDDMDEVHYHIRQALQFLDIE